MRPNRKPKKPFCWNFWFLHALIVSSTKYKKSKILKPRIVHILQREYFSVHESKISQNKQEKKEGKKLFNGITPLVSRFFLGFRWRRPGVTWTFIWPLETAFGVQPTLSFPHDLRRNQGFHVGFRQRTRNFQHPFDQADDVRVAVQFALLRLFLITKVHAWVENNDWLKRL